MARVQVGHVAVRVDPSYFRPTEVETLLGNPAKAKLGWVPEITFKEMVQDDLVHARKDKLCDEHWFGVCQYIE